MKRGIIITLQNDETLVEYIKSTKESMIDLQNQNEDIFGDSERYKKAKAFNMLEEFEKNILCIYLYCESYAIMERYMNIKKTSIAKEINRIKNKMLKL